MNLTRHNLEIMRLLNLESSDSQIISHILVMKLLWSNRIDFKIWSKTMYDRDLVN